MGKYEQIDAEGTIMLLLPPEYAERHAEFVAQIEERFGYEGLTEDLEADIDLFLTNLIERKNG